MGENCLLVQQIYREKIGSAVYEHNAKLMGSQTKIPKNWHVSLDFRIYAEKLYKSKNTLS